MVSPVPAVGDPSHASLYGDSYYHTLLDRRIILLLTIKLIQTLSSIFNLPTHRLKIRSQLSTRSNATSINTSLFLRSLFLPPGSSLNRTSHDESFSEYSGLKNISHHRQGSHSRSTKHKKIRSVPNNFAAAVHTHGNTEPLLMSGSGPIPEIMTSTFAASDPVLGPRADEPTKLPHSYSDPLPARRKRPSQSKLPLQLPHALVISGLEYTTDLTQRAFAKVLVERQVVLENNRLAEETNSRKTETDDDYGAWNLPDGFITVYVCPLNARERPPIHKTLVRIIHSLFSDLNHKHLPVGQICYEQ